MSGKQLNGSMGLPRMEKTGCDFRYSKKMKAISLAAVRGAVPPSAKLL